MYPTIESNQIGVIVRDKGSKLRDEIRQSLQRGEKVFLICKPKTPRKNDSSNIAHKPHA
jgi:hypothetical protein